MSLLKRKSRNRTTEYVIWTNMKQRCFNENNPAYKDYGGRGIGVCEEWKKSFKTFLKDMGRRPDGTSLDRIDNDKGYYKENCRWADKYTQASNKRNYKGYDITYEFNRKRPSKWRLRKTTQGKREHIGYFKTIKEVEKYIEKELG